MCAAPTRTTWISNQMAFFCFASVLFVLLHRAVHVYCATRERERIEKKRGLDVVIERQGKRYWTHAYKGKCSRRDREPFNIKILLLYRRHIVWQLMIDQKTLYTNTKRSWAVRKKAVMCRLTSWWWSSSFLHDVMSFEKKNKKTGTKLKKNNKKCPMVKNRLVLTGRQWRNIRSLFAFF